jgi:hypothetical protein
MGNDKPMYYSNGQYCDQKVEFEDWESKYSPGTWESTDQFDTLKECCVAKFYWDIEGCIASSPKELKFSFSIEINNIITPMYCQDADTMGNALETAINIGLGSDSISIVTAIGTATLGSDPDTGNTICGGSLAGSYSGNFDGTYPAGYYTSGTGSTTIKVDVSTKSASCTDSACLQALYDKIIAEFEAFVDSEDLTEEIQTWAANRAPPIPELFNAEVVSFSTTGTYTDPFEDPNGIISATSVTTTGTLSVSGLPTSMTSTQQQDLIEYFEASIADTLEEVGALPDGAIVTVTGITNGVVQYEVTMSADTSAEATTAVSLINTSLSQASTLSAITTAVQYESTGGSVSLTSLSVNGNTAGTSTETTVAKATSTGSLTTSVDTSGLSTGEVASMYTYFEDAIAETLQAQGAFPEGSVVTVTGIDANGVVSYEITMYTDPSEDLGSIVASIDSSLSQASTLTAITDSVKADASGVVSATSITTSGTLSVSGLTIGTADEMKEATSYFETAIVETLEAQGVLPSGATVTVTGFSDGQVLYEITLSAESTTDATQAVSQINSSLGQTSTLTAIKSTAIAEATADTSGSLSLTSLTVSSNTAGTSTTSTVSKATTSGELTTSVSTTGLTSAQIDEVATFFEDSITEQLEAASALPEGSFVTVTGIMNGVVSYVITTYNDPATASSTIVSTIASIQSTISSSLTEIQTSVIGYSVGSSVASTLSSLSVSSVTAGETTGIASTGSLATALSSMTVSGFTAGVTTGEIFLFTCCSYVAYENLLIVFILYLGVSASLYYPDFVNQKNGCINNGFEPAYMKNNPEYYMFSSKAECCDSWYSYDPFCKTSSSTKQVCITQFL